jgi:pimeloyl-ACP methyl ester carboxylesterase
LHDSLVARYPDVAAKLPAFPAKTWLAPSAEDWKLRCVMLTGYFGFVFASPQLSKDAEVRSLFARTAEAEAWRPVGILTDQDEEKRYRYVDIPSGVRIGYIEEGDSARPLVLFVHGFPDTLWTWDEIMKKVAPLGFYCVSMATRGYYPSSLAPSKAEEQDWQRYGKHVIARDVLQVISALGKTEAILVGHDWGAVAVWAAAALDQNEGTHLVYRVVCEAVPPPKAIALKPGLIIKARHIIYFNTPVIDTVGGTRASNYVYLDNLVERWSPNWKFDRKILDTVKRHYSKEGRLEAAIAYYKGMNYPKEAATIYDPINNTDIKCPVLFIGGEEDSGGGDQMSELFKQTALQCAGFCEVVIVREAGHFVHLEKSSAFMHKFGPFLQMTDVPDGKQTKIKYIQQTHVTPEARPPPPVSTPSK